MTTRTARRPANDAVLAGAVDLARAAAEELAEPGQVGASLGTEPDGERLVTHYFDCLNPAYRGWHWAGAAVAMGACGPWSPEYHRSTASSRPIGESTRARPRPSSHTATSSASVPVAV